jgi:hypothetical protein
MKPADDIAMYHPDLFQSGYFPRVGEMISFRPFDAYGRESYRVKDIVHVFGPTMAVTDLPLDRTYLILDPVGTVTEIIQTRSGTTVPWWMDENESIPVPEDDKNLIEGK